MCQLHLSFSWNSNLATFIVIKLWHRISFWAFIKIWTNIGSDEHVVQLNGTNYMNYHLKYTLILLYSTCAHWTAFTFYKYAPFIGNNFAIKICPFPCEFAHLAFNLFSRKSVKSTDCIVQNMSFKTVHNTKKRHQITARNSHRMWITENKSKREFKRKTYKTKPFISVGFFNTLRKLCQNAFWNVEYTIAVPNMHDRFSIWYTWQFRCYRKCKL